LLLRGAVTENGEDKKWCTGVKYLQEVWASNKFKVNARLHGDWGGVLGELGKTKKKTGLRESCFGVFRGKQKSRGGASKVHN